MTIGWTEVAAAAAIGAVAVGVPGAIVAMRQSRQRPLLDPEFCAVDELHDALWLRNQGSAAAHAVHWRIELRAIDSGQVLSLAGTIKMVLPGRRSRVYEPQLSRDELAALFDQLTLTTSYARRARGRQSPPRATDYDLTDPALDCLEQEE